MGHGTHGTFLLRLSPFCLLKNGSDNSRAVQAHKVQELVGGVSKCVELLLVGLHALLRRVLLHELEYLAEIATGAM